MSRYARTPQHLGSVNGIIDADHRRLRDLRDDHWPEDIVDDASRAEYVAAYERAYDMRLKGLL